MLRAETRSGEELLSLAAGAHKRHKATSLNDVDPLEIPTEQESKSSWRRDRDSLRGLRAPGADGAADGLRAPRDGGEYADFAGEDPAMGERGRPSGLLATGRAAGGSRSGGASAPALRQGAAGLGPGGQGTTEGAQHGAAVKPALTAVAGGNTLTALASTVKLEAGCYKVLPRARRAQRPFHARFRRGSIAGIKMRAHVVLKSNLGTCSQLRGGGTIRIRQRPPLPPLV